MLSIKYLLLIIYYIVFKKSPCTSQTYEKLCVRVLLWAHFVVVEDSLYVNVSVVSVSICHLADTFILKGLQSCGPNGYQTHDLGVASATLYSLSHRGHRLIQVSMSGVHVRECSGTPQGSQGSLNEILMW